MRLTTAQLRATHDALHRLVAHGEAGDTNYAPIDALVALEKISSELRTRERRSPAPPTIAPPVEDAQDGER